MGPQYKRNLGQEKRSQQRATEMARGHEHHVQERAEAGGGASDLDQLQSIRSRLVNNMPYQEEPVFPDPKTPIGQIMLDYTGELPKKEDLGDLVLFSLSPTTHPHRAYVF